jgi:hypothetical protein
MRTASRRLATAATLATVAALVVGLAPAATAATPPDWPAAGRVPSGCDPVITVGGSAAAPTYTYTDSTYPTVLSVGYDLGCRIVVPPAGVTTKFSVKLRQTCSGVRGVSPYVRVTGSSTIFAASALTPLTTDAFSSTWSTPAGLIPAGAGLRVQFPIAIVDRRYSTFTLDRDFEFVSATDATDQHWTQGPWSDDWTYILRASRLSSAVSKAKVAKGTTISVTGLLQLASPGTWSAYAGGKATLQTKVGAGAWKNRATVTASAGGALTAPLKVKKRTQVRFVIADLLVPPYVGAGTSPVRTVKIA